MIWGSYKDSVVFLVHTIYKSYIMVYAGSDLNPLIPFQKKFPPFGRRHSGQFSPLGSLDSTVVLDEFRAEEVLERVVGFESREALL